MRNPPNYGSITKLKGNRRRPFMVRITTGRVVNFDTKKAYNKQIVLGYYATRKDAAQALAEYNANNVNPDFFSITIRQIWNRIKDKIDVSSSRMSVYESKFRTYIEPIADKRIADVRAGTLQDLFDSIDKGSGVKSIVRTVLNHIYTYAAQNDIIQQNYVDYIHIQQDDTKIQREIYSAEEVAEIWTHEGTRDFDFMLVLLYEGMRIKELRDMKKDSVDLDEWTFRIQEGKNQMSVRTIPIHDKIKPIIRRAMESSGSKLFNVSEARFKYFIKTTFPNHKPYDTRHTFATKANKVGIPKLTIQRIMGHKPDSILEQAYIHLTIEELRSNLNRIEY